ncbi:MAG: hypothetical protein JJW00_05780 [Sulfurimonas sp.]|nr:hypothetical protein [Sulfurimonas sp.]
MFSKLLELMYNKIYVNIVLEYSRTIIYIEECGRKGSVLSESETFETTNVSAKMYEYIDSFISESPFFYISILDTSVAQGAIPTCKSKEMSKFYDLEVSKYICYKKKWTYYTSKADLNKIQKKYGEIGVDFIFSPFVLLTNFFKDKIDSSLAIFLLVEDGRLSLSIFNNSELLFAQYIIVQHSNKHSELTIEDDNTNIDLELEAAIDLEEIDDLESVDDFGEIEDLDSFDEIDEFSEEEDNSLIEDSLATPEDEETGFNEDYQRYSLIQSSVSDFYKGKKYKSEFVQDIYIADGVGVSRDLKRYLEEEMFLNVFIRQLDLCYELSELAKMEQK